MQPQPQHPVPSVESLEPFRSANGQDHKGPILLVISPPLRNTPHHPCSSAILHSFCLHSCSWVFAILSDVASCAHAAPALHQILPGHRWRQFRHAPFIPALVVSRIPPQSVPTFQTVAAARVSPARRTDDRFNSPAPGISDDRGRRTFFGVTVERVHIQ